MKKAGSHFDIRTDRRILAAALAAAVVFLVLFSAFYVSAEAHHVCSGEDCPICACIQLCETVVRRIGGGILASVCVLLFTAAGNLLFFTEIKAIAAATPVTQKVRLNN